MHGSLQNFIDGTWRPSNADQFLPVANPATAEELARVPLSPGIEVDQGARAAANAFPGWRATPPTERVRYLFRLKGALEEHFEELARTITLENGKTLAEARGELRRAIENVEVACGIPTLMQGQVLEDIAPGIDEHMIRQPVGVCAIVAPFNFPGMIPFWFLPYALATGNTAIVKPSEQTPITMTLVFGLLEELDFPPGVVNLVHGAADTVNALLDHPEVAALSFVGSTPVAQHVYARAASQGKRVQAQGGAKNPLVILPDADLDMTTRIVADSAFGNAGQRCLAASLAITVGEAGEPFTRSIAAAARDRVVGDGLEEGVEMGPVITPESKSRILGLIERGIQEGATLLVDGRQAEIPRLPHGSFLRPTVLTEVSPGSEIATTEIFGPVLGMCHVDSLEEAIKLVNRSHYGNMACLFTRDGAAARQFRYHVQAGNVGINIGVAAPMAFFPFSGWKDSFFGVVHGQGRHAVEFFTQTKVVVERWLQEWSRKF